MPGVRLRHPTLRNCTYTLVHYGRPLVAPHQCSVCAMTHYDKTYHLGLDSLGEVVVSETVFQRLEEAGLDELKAAREEPKPEPIIIDMNTTETLLVVSRENGHRGRGRSWRTA